MGDAPTMVSIDTYALVTAGIADGIPLTELLTHVGLEVGAWERADADWTERVLDDLEAEGGLCFELDQKRTLARETFVRSIPPLDQQIDAWIDFQRALGSTPAPIALLDSIPLRPTDLGWLQQLWSKRLESDESLRAKLREVLDSPPNPVRVPVPPRVRLPGAPEARPAEPRLLASTPEVSSSVQTDGPSSIGLFSVRLPTESEGAPASADEQRPSLPLSAAVAPGPLVSVPGIEAPASPQRVEVPSYLANPPAVAARSSRRNPLLETSLAMPGLKAPALPFREGQASPPAPAPEASGVAPKPRVGAGTSLALPIPAASALPFQSGTAAAPLPPPGEAAQAKVDVSASMPKVAKKNPALAGTSLALDVPRGPATPFQPGPAPKADPLLSTVATSKAARAALSGTSMALPVPREAPLPFASAPKAAPGALDAGTSPPPLTIPQYASLCEDVERAPEQRAATLAAYKLDEAANAALDERYRALFAADPAARASFEQSVVAYREYLAARGGAR